MQVYLASSCPMLYQLARFSWLKTSLNMAHCTSRNDISILEVPRISRPLLLHKGMLRGAKIQLCCIHLAPDANNYEVLSRPRRPIGYYYTQCICEAAIMPCFTLAFKNVN